MTSSDDNEPRDLPRQSMAAAASDLARVRAAVETATHAGASSEELKEAVQGYLDEHGPALHTAASALGEEARRQMLLELYKWRAQLAAQLEDQTRRKPSNWASNRQPGQPGRPQ